MRGSDPEKHYICTFCDRQAKWYRLMGGYVRRQTRMTYQHVFACDAHLHCLNKDARHDLNSGYSIMRAKAVCVVHKVPI